MHYLLKFFSLFSFVVFFATSASSETISPDDASQYVGRNVTVEGVVRQVSSSRGGTTFINFGGRYPNHVFYAVIFKKYANRFSNARAYDGRHVAISGEIGLYKGKPQIILFSPSQIQMK
jgi:DNA/RNA endonuclease YhcR with UshA esterase domain